jgi:hypothetical protein
MSSLCTGTESNGNGMTFSDDNRRLTLFWMAALALAAVFAAAPAVAQTAMERLVMPGELSEHHAKYQAECGSCHKPLSRTGQVQLCLDCHKDVAADVRSKTRFHGTSAAATNNECRHCHSEHKGRKADIVQLDRTTFDHAATAFALAGAHLTTACAACHADGKKFRTAPTACAECHKKDDVHRGRLSGACSDCHTDKGWKPAKAFDHSKTAFPLTGSHADVDCKGCHAGERYKGVPTGCFGCHRERDIHSPSRGVKCEGCHTTKTWTLSENFDHDRDTKFTLRGKHSTKICADCHKQPPREVKLATACGTCHKKDDVHKGQLGDKCQSCHNESGFKVGVLFDHDATRFPLAGKHRSAACGDCHKTQAYKDAPVNCVACHKKDEKHAGRLGQNCAQCHSPSGWAGARFDHAKTQFALTGRHAQTGCYGCHKQTNVARATLPTDCYSCHKAADRHRGAFGRNCGSCHTTSTFGVAYIKR